MSFHHYLTLGHLNLEAIGDGRAVAEKPLDPDILSRLLRETGSVGASGNATLGGYPVQLHDGYVTVAWYTPGTNDAAVRFALRLHAETGCVIAEVAKRRLIRLEQLLPQTLTTHRLLLRPWRDEDLPAFAAMNADPRVMEYMPAPLTRAESDAMVRRIRDHFDRHGFGLWAVGIPNAAPFAGFVGLAVPAFEAHFTPCVEVGWRLAFEHWGHGYATEAARAALDFAFGRLGLAEVVSFTAVANRRSRRVMERLGMTHSPADDFDHPRLPEGHPLRRHVLYRLRPSPQATSADAPRT